MSLNVRDADDIMTECQLELTVCIIIIACMGITIVSLIIKED